MPTPTFTPEKVAAYYGAMERRFGVRYSYKPDDSLARYAASALKLLGIMDAERFLHDYATTLPDPLTPQSAVILIPFKPGIAEGRWSLEAQVRVAPHELVHALQVMILGPGRYTVEYLADEHARAVIYEQPALGTAMELAHAWGEQLPDPAALAAKLFSYNCGKDAVDACAVALESRRDIILAGGHLTEPASETISWWQENG